MQNKYLTLQTIYELVKNDSHPTSRMLYPNEIILRQNFPWDESIKHLDELRSEHFVNILQHSPIAIFITEEGFQYMNSTNKNKQGKLMYAA